MKISTRIAITLITWACFIGRLTSSAESADQPTDGNSSKNRAPASAEPPQVRVTISRETTRITEPLRPDGYVDYVAALNRRLGAGVTPDNNAAVLIWRAIGPKAIRPRNRDRYFDLLEIDALPDDGDYFVERVAFMLNQREPPKDRDHTFRRIDEDVLQLNATQKRAWTAEEFPRIAAWLSINQKPLSLVVEASRRPCCFDPISSPEGRLVSAWPPGFQPLASECRELAYAFICRATLRVGQHDVTGAWEDLLTVHRLAGHVGRQPFIKDAIVAYAIDGTACHAENVLLQQTELTIAQAARISDDLNKLPRLPKLSEAVDIGERWSNLDLYCTAARDGAAALREMAAAIDRSRGDNRATPFPDDDQIDWNELLRKTNAESDEFAAALRLPVRCARVALIKEIEAGRKRALSSTSQPNANHLPVAKARGQEVVEQVRIAVDQLMKPLFPLLFVQGCEDEAAMRRDLIRIGVALAAYKAMNHSYPQTLQALAPRFTTEVPQDLFRGGALQYKPANEGYLLYSVGQNERDDGGKSYENSGEDGTWDDLSVRVPAGIK